MIAYAKRLTASKFVRNVAIVASGTAGAQAITMAFAPIITRLYGPEAFGVMGTYNAIWAVLAPIAALSYPIAIVLPKRDADAIGIAKLSLGIAVAMSLLTALILLMFKASIVNTFNLQTVEPFILLLPFAMLFSATMAIMSQWMLRKKLFKLIAKVAVLQALWLNIAKAGIGLLSPLAAVLILLVTFGNALHTLMLWIGGRKSSTGRIEVSSLPGEGVVATSKSLAWRHKDFAYYRTPQFVLNALSDSMPVLMLASLFGPTVAGFYALARTVVGVPSRLIGKSVQDVFYPKFVEILHLGKSGKAVILKACLSLLGVSALPYLFLMLFGPLIFSLVFGDDWGSAGEFARWMSVWILAAITSRPTIAAIPALGLQGEFLIFEMIFLLVRGSAVLLGYLIFSSAIVVVAFFSLVSVVMYFFLILYVISRT